MLLGAAVVVGYTIMGGFLAVSDHGPDPEYRHEYFFLIVVVFFGISYAGGWGAVVDNAKSMSGYLKHDPHLQFMQVSRQPRPTDS